MENLELIQKTVPSFYYMANCGNSRTGKTTLTKTWINQTPYDVLLICDPNNQYSDLMNEKAQNIGPVELQNAISQIARKLCMLGKKGILVIEDLHLTLKWIQHSLCKSEREARNIIKLLLENLGKYDIKVIVVMHDIDPEIMAKCDLKVFFQTPLTDYAKRTYSKRLNFDLSEIGILPKFHYRFKNGGDIEKGYVEPLPSHQAVEQDKSFGAKTLIQNCSSLIKKVTTLRAAGFKNGQIAELLNVTQKTVENRVNEARHKGANIPDARKTLLIQNSVI